MPDHQDPGSPLSTVLGIIESLPASSCLLCARSTPVELEAACKALNCSLTKVEATEPIESLPQQRFDLAIVADCLEHISPNEGQQLLGRLRNVHSNHLAVLVAGAPTMPEAESAPTPSHTEWPDSFFYSLGMKHSRTFYRTNEQSLRLYTYAIESYNHKREWNNSRFWANPENFNLYWW